MEILKAFVFEGIEHKIRTVNTDDGIIFSAADLGKVLGMVNIRTTLANFDDDQKHVLLI